MYIVKRISSLPSTGNFAPNMAMMKISASFSQRMDAPGPGPGAKMSVAGRAHMTWLRMRG